MAVLLIGGTGKVGQRLASLLKGANVPVILTSRKGQDGVPESTVGAEFDWSNKATWEKPFESSVLERAGAKAVSAVYIVVPPTPDPNDIVIELIDLVRSKHGVRRFVLVGGSTLTKGGPFLGRAWQHLEDIGAEFAVLRPTWFAENLLEYPAFKTITEEGKIYSGTGDAKIPFVSASDIAAVAFHALTDEKPHNDAHRILGPEAISYDEVAAKLTSVLGRDVVHVKLNSEENLARLLALGFPEGIAKFLVYIEGLAGQGLEEKRLPENAVEKVIGKPPVKFDDWLESNKGAFKK